MCNANPTDSLSYVKKTPLHKTVQSPVTSKQKQSFHLEGEKEPEIGDFYHKKTSDSKAKTATQSSETKKEAGALPQNTKNNPFSGPGGLKPEVQYGIAGTPKQNDAQSVSESEDEKRAKRQAELDKIKKDLINYLKSRNLDTKILGDDVKDIAYVIKLNKDKDCQNIYALYSALISEDDEQFSKTINNLDKNDKLKAALEKFDFLGDGMPLVLCEKLSNVENKDEVLKKIIENVDSPTLCSAAVVNQDGTINQDMFNILRAKIDKITDKRDKKKYNKSLNSVFSNMNIDDKKREEAEKAYQKTLGPEAKLTPNDLSISKDFSYDDRYLETVKIKTSDTITEPGQLKNAVNLPDGQLMEIGGKLYIKDKDTQEGYTELKMNPKQFYELFGTGQNFSQGRTGNCYFLASLNGLMMKSESAKAIFKSFSVDKNGNTTCQIPGYPFLKYSVPANETVYQDKDFSGGELARNGINDIKWVNMLELTYGLGRLLDTLDICSRDESKSSFLNLFLTLLDQDGDAESQVKIQLGNDVYEIKDSGVSVPDSDVLDLYHVLKEVGFFNSDDPKKQNIKSHLEKALEKNLENPGPKDVVLGRTLDSPRRDVSPLPNGTTYSQTFSATDDATPIQKELIAIIMEKMNIHGAYDLAQVSSAGGYPENVCRKFGLQVSDVQLSIDEIKTSFQNGEIAVLAYMPNKEFGQGYLTIQPEGKENFIYYVHLYSLKEISVDENGKLRFELKNPHGKDDCTLNEDEFIATCKTFVQIK